MNDRSMVWDQLRAAARDAAIASPFYDLPDDRPSRDEVAADNHDIKRARDAEDARALTLDYIGGSQ